MHEMVLHSGWDTFLFGLVFIGLLAVGVFRLDESFTSRKGKAKKKSRVTRPPSGVDRDGSQLMSDPDGKTWRVPPKRG